jgi:transcriptional regulator with XRE-family HTH domain
MTQAELAGGEITRNMLSRIENGAAQPSIGTVKYIAARLNVSPGFLLAGEDDELLYFKASEIENVKKAYEQKNFRLCRDICLSSGWSDDELRLILCESSLGVGIEEFCDGDLRRAVELFEEAVECAEQTVYNTDIVVSCVRAYSDYMQMISPTLSVYVSEAGEGIRVMSDPFCVYSDLICEADTKGFDGIFYLEERMEPLGEDSPYFMHVSARILMERGEYAQAHAILRRLLFDDRLELPQPMLYFIFCDLEVCCKETDDFKGAYEYSGSKLSLLQKLIS